MLDRGRGDEQEGDMRYVFAVLIIIGFVVVVIALFVPDGIVGTLRKYVPELRGIIE